MLPILRYFHSEDELIFWIWLLIVEIVLPSLHDIVVKADELAVCKFVTN